MVAPAMQVEIADSLSEALSVRRRRKVFKGANEAAAILWRDELLKKHFQSGAATRYQYVRRAKSTIEKKQRLAKHGVVKHGGRRPLVHSGVLKAAMSRLHVIRATSRQATVSLQGPSYFRINYRAGRPNLGAEVTRVAAQELPQISEASEAAADKIVEQTKPKRKRVK